MRLWPGTWTGYTDEAPQGASQAIRAPNTAKSRIGDEAGKGGTIPRHSSENKAETATKTHKNKKWTSYMRLAFGRVTGNSFPLPRHVAAEVVTP